jgi:hypothetical protein
MKNFILLSKKSLTFFFLLTSVFLFAQTTVNNNAGASTDFTSLQAAVDAATAGDVIYVQHSPTSYGNVILNKGVTIIGRSSRDNGYRTTVGTIQVAGGATGAVIRGLNISSVTETGSVSSISNLSFFDNDVTSTFFVASAHNVDNILIQGNIFRSSFYNYAKSSNILVTNNIFLSPSLFFYTVDTLLFSNNVIAAQSTGANLYNQSTSGLLNISNCIFVINSGATRTIDLVEGSGSIQVDNCISYNYNSSWAYNFETGAGITINANVQSNINPLFTNIDTNLNQSIAGTSADFDPVIDDLTLQGTSTVTDAGLYEGYNFINNGNPTGYPSLKVTNYSPTVPKNGNLSVTIEAQTN